MQEKCKYLYHVTIISSKRTLVSLRKFAENEITRNEVYALYDKVVKRIADLATRPRCIAWHCYGAAYCISFSPPCNFIIYPFVGLITSDNVSGTDAGSIVVCNKMRVYARNKWMMARYSAQLSEQVYNSICFSLLFCRGFVKMELVEMARFDPVE